MFENGRLEQTILYCGRSGIFKIKKAGWRTNEEIFFERRNDEIHSRF